jgi:phage shock protein C
MIRTKNKSRFTDNYSSYSTPFAKEILDVTLEEFLDTEEPKKLNTFNLATISGAVILTITFIYIFSNLGLLSGVRFQSIAALPIIGGLLLLLTGISGRFMGEKRKKRPKRRAKNTSDDVYGADDLRYESRVHSKFDVFGAGNSKSEGMGSTREKQNQEPRSTGFQDDSTTSSWSYFQQRKNRKLTKSRSDKKLWGVCGGLGEFFGISSVWVRLIFVAAFFMGWGSSLFIYIALGLILNKGPLDLDHPEQW